MIDETRYGKFRRCALSLWREHNGTRLEDKPYRQYCVNLFNETVIAADLAWPGDGPTYPHNLCGSDHLRDHLASDWALTEQDEVRFRAWWAGVMTTGFLLPKQVTP